MKRVRATIAQAPAAAGQPIDLLALATELQAMARGRPPAQLVALLNASAVLLKCVREQPALAAPHQDDAVVRPRRRKRLTRAARSRPAKKTPRKRRAERTHAIEPDAAPATNGAAGDVQVDVDRGEVSYRGQAVVLAGKPLQVVAVTVRHFGKQLRRDFIIDTVWGADKPATADTLLSQAISTANDRLRDLGIELKSERGAGCALQRIGG